MAAKTKLLHQSSLRGQAYGSSPSEQQEHLLVSLQTSRNLYMKSSQTNSRTKPRRSATIRPRTSTKICCGSTLKRSGATVGNVIPGYPRGGPKHTHSDRVGRADQVQTVLIRTTCCARLQEASSGVGIGSDLPCITRDIVVTD